MKWLLSTLKLVLQLDFIKLYENVVESFVNDMTEI